MAVRTVLPHTKIEIPILPAVGVEARLEQILAKATDGVRPSDRMLGFYNRIGRLPLHLGAVLLFLTSVDAVKVIWQAAVRKRTDAALQIIYDYRMRPLRGPWAFGDQLWQGSFNCGSVRARGRFVQEAAHFLLGHRAEERFAGDGHDRKLEVVSLGSGSANQFLQGIADNGFSAENIHAILVDRDPRALAAGIKNARRVGLENAVGTQEATVGLYLRQVVIPGSVDFVEMVGLADYFEDIRLEEYLQGIHRALRPGGFFLGANIGSREEMDYAHGAACWPPMEYRSREKLLEMLEGAGFRAIWMGDCGLYTVWVAKKGENDPLRVI